jgi:DNA polymerase III subunit delta'
MIFPWQGEQWQQLWRAKQDNRLAHAVLFSGIAGTGKSQFAEYFARALLCKEGERAREEQHGKDCHHCRLVAGRTHPNMLWIEPEKEGQAIKVDQIREVSDFINQSSFNDGIRIVLINPADAMNMNAANALLKTLEEPSSGCIMILISHQHARLPATILSRCQRIIFPSPKKEQALTWLQLQLTDSAIDPELILNLAYGAPLAALRLVQDDALSARHNLFQALCQLNQQQSDPIALAAKLRECEPLPLLNFMLAWMQDLLRLQLGETQDRLINKDYATELLQLKQKTDFNSNAKFMDYLQDLRGQMSAGFNLNKQLVIETILIKWLERI